MFDSYDYFKKLKAAGYTEAQAKVLTETLVELINSGLLRTEASEYEEKNKKRNNEFQKMGDRLLDRLTINLSLIMTATFIICVILARL